MRDFSPISAIPEVPAVYALYAEARSEFVVYVGISSKLRGRVYQHLVMRDSSAVVESAPIQINVDSISSIRWWEHELFFDRARLEGAELVAFEVLKPTMRSRGGISSRARDVVEDEKFTSAMHELFLASPSGGVSFPGIRDLSSRLDALENRVISLESRVNQVENLDS